MSAGFQGSLRQSAAITFRVWWRIARQLFLEVAGAFFAIFAVYGSLMAWRQWHAKPTALLVGAALAYALLMAFFSVTSFMRARRIR
jgi:hypothetical protein